MVNISLKTSGVFPGGPVGKCPSTKEIFAIIKWTEALTVEVGGADFGDRELGSPETSASTLQ